MRRTLPFLLALLAVPAVAACSKEKSGGVDVGIIKKIQRGEWAAVASYDKAIEKLSGALKPELVRIRDEHTESAKRLGERLTALGATAETPGSPWESFTKFLTGSTGAISDNGGLDVLKQGEKHGEEEYEGALKKDDIDAPTKDAIRQSLLPRVLEHQKALDALKK